MPNQKLKAYTYCVAIILRLALASLFLVATVSGQTPHEELLTPDNAYNPIPSPDGHFIAYVRTGWGEMEETGMGRSSLVSEVRVLKVDAPTGPKIVAKQFFISGWTPDDQIVCYRDSRYAVVTTEGKQVFAGNIQNDPGHIERWTEWVAYAPSFKTLLWTHAIRDWDRTIETQQHTIASFTGNWAKARVVPSPDGHYLAVFSESPDTALQIYDLTRKSWTQLGKITIHPDKDWSYIQPNWNPWFPDSSRLVFIRDSSIVIAKPDGTSESKVEVPGTIGLPTASPDGKQIVYVTSEPRPMKGRPDLQFWGSTTIFAVPVSGATAPQPVTTKNDDEVLDLKWLTNDTILFDRIADEPFYHHARIWKAVVPR